MSIKTWEGLEVIAKPLGNNARYNKNIKNFTITKVARVNMYIKFDKDSIYDYKCRVGEIDTTHKYVEVIDDCNSGWLLFKTIDDYDTYLESIELTKSFNHYFGNNRGILNMSVEDMRTIKGIIDSNQGRIDD